jgi:Flp pilus assembly protein TadG
MAELAVVLPIFAFLLVAGLDFARVFYHCQTVTNCARNGALYACDPVGPLRYKYTDYRECAIADGQSLVPPLVVGDVTSAGGSDAYGATVAVTVNYNVTTLSSYLGFSTVAISKTVTMRVIVVTPDP